MIYLIYLSEECTCPVGRPIGGEANDAVGGVSSRLVSSRLVSWRLRSLTFARSLHKASVVVLAVRRVQLVVEVAQPERRRAALHGVRVQERDAEEPEKVRHAPGPVQRDVPDTRKRFGQGEGGIRC